MSTVLVPLDRSPATEAAIPTAERVARNLGADVVLLAVGQLAETPEQKDEEQALNEQVFERARPHFKGLNVRQRVTLSGSPLDAILEAIDEEHAEVVVLATDGRAGRTGVARPDVADALKDAGVQVETVPYEAEV